jgi:hypothetical protein
VAPAPAISPTAGQHAQAADHVARVLLSYDADNDEVLANADAAHSQQAATRTSLLEVEAYVRLSIYGALHCSSAPCDMRMIAAVHQRPKRRGNGLIWMRSVVHSNEA